MSDHRTKGKKLIAGQASGRNHIQCGIIFGIAKDALLRSAAIVEQDDIFSRLAFIGNNDFVVEVKITRLKKV